MSFFKRLINNYRMNKQFKELSKNDDFNKNMLTYLFTEKKIFFRLTEEEKSHLNTQIETCSEEDFGDLNFDVGVYKNGELAYLMSCFHQPKSIIETDNAYQYLCENFPSFNERNTEEE